MAGEKGQPLNNGERMKRLVLQKITETMKCISSQAWWAGLFFSLFCGSSLAQFNPATELTVAHDLGDAADLQFRWQDFVNTDAHGGCPNLGLVHGSSPIVNIDFNHDGHNDYLVPYKCTDFYEEEFHPLYYIGYPTWALVVLINDEGSVENGNQVVFGKDLVKWTHFSRISYDWNDDPSRTTRDFNQDGFDDLLWFSDRDGQWTVMCFSDEDPNCQQMDAYKEERAQSYEGQFGYRHAYGSWFGERGVLLSKPDGTYENHILATGRDCEPLCISILLDDQGRWNLWFSGHPFSTASQWGPTAAEQQQGVWNVPTSDGVVLPKPGSRVYRFEPEDGLVEVTDKYYVDLPRPNEPKGPEGYQYCRIPKTVYQAAGYDECVRYLAGYIPQDGNEVASAWFWGERAMLPIGDHGIVALNNVSEFNPSNFSGEQWKNFWTDGPNCPLDQQQESMCAADSGFGNVYERPIIRTFKLVSDVGLVETTNQSTNNIIRLTPHLEGTFWRYQSYESRPWNFSTLSRPHQYMPASVKLDKNSDVEYVIVQCCRGNHTVDIDIDPLSIPLAERQFLVGRDFFWKAWSPDNCPWFLEGVDASHCVSDGYLGLKNNPNVMHPDWPEQFFQKVESYMPGITQLEFRHYVSARTDYLAIPVNTRTGEILSLPNPLSVVEPWVQDYRQIKVADLNGDGFEDLWGTHIEPPRAWARNTGFESVMDYPAPLAIYLNDAGKGFVRNSSLDHTRSYLSGEIQQYFDGVLPLNYMVGYYPGHHLADMNGDGIFDIVNSNGESEDGSPYFTHISYGEPIYPEPAVPSKPIIAHAEVGDEEIYLWVSVGSSVGSPVSLYEATCTASSGEAVVATSQNPSITIRGVVNGTSYVCRVTATNLTGVSQPSDYSVTLVPEGVPMGLPIWLLYEANKRS